MRASSGLINQLSSNERDVCARGGRRGGGGELKKVSTLPHLFSRQFLQNEHSLRLEIETLQVKVT